MYLHITPPKLNYIFDTITHSRKYIFRIFPNICSHHSSEGGDIHSRHSRAGRLYIRVIPAQAEIYIRVIPALAEIYLASFPRRRESNQYLTRSPAPIQTLTSVPFSILSSTLRRSYQSLARSRSDGLKTSNWFHPTP